MIAYFAYGSNLSRSRLRERVGDWNNEKKATLKDYKLTFKRTSGDTGVANIEESEGDTIYGAIYYLTEEQMKKLDGHEGTPFTYKREEVEVVSDSGKNLKAIAYILVKGFNPKKPSKGYLNLILLGLKEHNYSEEIINKIEKIALMSL